MCVGLDIQKTGSVETISLLNPAVFQVLVSLFLCFVDAVSIIPMQVFYFMFIWHLDHAYISCWVAIVLSIVGCCHTVCVRVCVRAGVCRQRIVTV